MVVVGEDVHSRNRNAVGTHARIPVVDIVHGLEVVAGMEAAGLEQVGWAVVNYNVFIRFALLIPFA